MDGLKLRAEDEEDLSVVAGSLQDALVAVGDIAWLQDQRRFALVVNRFCWDSPPDAEGRHWRRHAALAFDTVLRAALRGFDRRVPDRVLNLLTIEAASLQSGGMAVTLTFSGGAAIRLEVERILCHLEDVGEPWPTLWQPSHPAG